MLASYRPILNLRRAPSLIATSFLGRMANAMIGLAILLVVEDAASFAAAGIAAGAFTLVTGFTAPARGRLIDRHGARPILIATGIAQLVAQCLLIAAASADASATALVTISAATGIVFPPVSAATRGIWPRILNHPDDLPTAYAFDAATEELAFLVGPLVVALILTVGSSSATVAVEAALEIAACLGLAAIAPAAEAGSSSAGRWGPLSRGGVRIVLTCLTLAGVAAGTMEIAVLAFTSDRGQPQLVGVMFALFGAGSLVGAAAFGAWKKRPPLHDTYIGLAALDVVALALVVFATSLVALAVGLILVGLAAAATAACGYALIEGHTPRSMLTETFTWVTTASLTGISAGSALGGLLVTDHGTRVAFLFMWGAAAASLIPLLLWRPSLRLPTRPDASSSVPSEHPG